MLHVASSLASTNLNWRNEMNAYMAAPVWDDDDENHRCPHTCKTARTVGAAKVENVYVIDAPHASYRLAHFGGTFVLAESVKLPLPTKGWHKVEVYCLWFGHRLKTRGPKFNIDMSKARVRKAKSCEVVFNIAK